MRDNKKEVPVSSIQKPETSDRVKMKGPDGKIVEVKPQHVPAHQYQGFVLVDKKEA